MSRAYGPALGPLLKGDLDFDTVTLKAMLCTSAYVPDYGADEFRADITGELVATGYTTGGITLTGLTVTFDPPNSDWAVNADDAAFGVLTGTGIEHLVIYVDTGSAATDLLLVDLTFDPESPSGETFTYQFDADFGFLGHYY